MSIASRIFLAATVVAGLMVPGGAQAAVQGFSITLSDMTFERGSGLSAEAAAFGGNGPVELLKNGSYNETLTGDYAVADNLPPSDQLAYWQTFTQISLNGTPFLTANQLVFESQDQVFVAILNLTHLNPLVLKIIIGTLEHHNNISTGIFDYAYNPPPTASDRTHGTFAVGSTEGGFTDDPLSVFEPVSASSGPNVWSLAFSATFFAPAPEPPTWVMLIAGGGGLLAIRTLRRRRKVARRVPA
jgi:hypothetical protein